MSAKPIPVRPIPYSDESPVGLLIRATYYLGHWEFLNPRHF